MLPSGSGESRFSFDFEVTQARCAGQVTLAANPEVRDRKI